MSRCQLSLMMKTVCLSFLNFKTLALLHKNFGNLLENVKIVQVCELQAEQLYISLHIVPIP